MTIPRWWEILIGILLILLGISLMFIFSPKASREVRDYKDQQLIEFKKNNPKFKGDYKQSKLILPWSQRMKLSCWPIIGISLIIVGITFSTGFVFKFFVR